MQTLESIISLLVLISLSTFLLIPADSKIDNSLYLYALQGDVKNVMHLKGGFENITRGNEIAMEIFQETGLCMELSETDITSYNVENGFSSQVTVPELKDLILKANQTEIDLPRSNLTGFARNALSFGVCQ